MPEGEQEDGSPMSWCQTVQTNNGSQERYTAVLTDILFVGGVKHGVTEEDLCWDLNSSLEQSCGSLNHVAWEWRRQSWPWSESMQKDL